MLGTFKINPVTDMSIEKLTSLMIFPVKPFAEIDKSFNWINSLKQYRYVDHKQREIKKIWSMYL